MEVQLSGGELAQYTKGSRITEEEKNLILQITRDSQTFPIPDMKWASTTDINTAQSTPLI